MRNFYGVLTLILFIYGCKTPQASVTPVPVTNQVYIKSAIVDEELQIRLENYIKSPVQFHVSVPDPEINSLLKDLQPIILKAEQDTLIRIPVKGKPDLQPVFKVDYGDPEKQIAHSPVLLPVRRYKPIRILQGHNGSYSHHQDRNRYAIDFKLNIGDTVYSASDGFVVQVKKDFKYGGKNKKWLDMANKIIVYDPATGRIFQYSHLVHQGSFVKQGDEVKQGQPIGLSGNTGYSDTPHLHFVVLIPDTAKGLISVPVDFIDGFKGEDLKKNTVLQQERQNSVSSLGSSGF